MNLKTAIRCKGVCSAALLSCLVIALSVITQPAKVDQTKEVNNVEQTQVNVPPRKYDSHTAVGSRAEKPEKIVEPAALAKPTKPTSDFTYTVMAGDTLSELALTYGVTVDNIMAANGLNSDKLSLEQKLLIPVSGNIQAVAAAKTAPKAVKQVQHSTKPTDSRTRYDGRPAGQLVKWSEARNIFGIGETATVIDVNTGYSFKVKRKGGHNHADCEPLTSVDTAVMKKIYGSWSWNRRAIVVEVKGKKIAASMAGMPHGSSSISGNGFAGHFDVHFSGSMTHGSEYTKTRVPITDPDHQAMVKKASAL